MVYTNRSKIIKIFSLFLISCFASCHDANDINEVKKQVIGFNYEDYIGKEVELFLSDYPFDLNKYYLNGEYFYNYYNVGNGIFENPRDSIMIRIFIKNGFKIADTLSNNQKFIFQEFKNRKIKNIALYYGKKFIDYY